MVCAKVKLYPLIDISVRASTTLVVAALALADSPLQACSMRMAVEIWPPYVYRDSAAQLTGLDIALTRAILKEAGCTLNTQASLPSLRRDVLFREGKIDLLMAASETLERHHIARFSIAYRDESVRLFTTPEHLRQYSALDSFEAIVKQGARLLAPNAGWYGPAYARAQDTLRSDQHLSTFGNFEQGIRMLAAGRANLIMGDGAALQYAARQVGVPIVALPYTVMRGPVHLMLNRVSTSAADLRRINEAIARLSQRGDLKTIRAAYGELR